MHWIAGSASAEDDDSTANFNERTSRPGQAAPGGSVGVRAALTSPEVPESAKRQLAKEHDLPYPPPAKHRTGLRKRLRDEMPDPGGCLLLLIFLAIAVGAAILGSFLTKALV